MTIAIERVAQVRPKLIERQCGGWLAVSETGSYLMIGVTGCSKEDAQQRFDAALAEWCQILEASAEGQKRATQI